MSESHVPYRVSVSDTLRGATWERNYNLICDRLTMGTAPTMDSASLRFHFGTMQTRELDTGDPPVEVVNPELAYVPPLELRGKFVRIQAVAVSLDWVGYVLDERMNRGPQEDDGLGAERISRGDQFFEVVGLEWFLARQQITSSVIYDGGDGIRIDRAIGYNQGLDDGRGLAYEIRGNKDTRGDNFAADYDHAEAWDGWTIAGGVLADHPPADKDDNLEPCDFVLDAGAEDFLSWFEPAVPTENRTVWQVLNAVISPRRGLVWWLGYDDATETATVYVSSMATADLSIPTGGTLPEAATKTALTDREEFRPQISWPGGRHYDVIVCRGARRRAIFTVSTASGNLATGWLSTEETAYKAAASGDVGYSSLSDAEKKKKNDRMRRAKRFERVFADFVIPPTWDGKSNDGAGAPGSTAFACPRPPQGSLSFGAGDEESLNTWGIRLLRTLPIYAGWNYDDATAPVANDKANLSGEFLQPFGVVQADGTNWEFLDKLDGDFHSYRLTMLADHPGVRIDSTGMNHTLADNHWSGAAVSSDDAEIDYEDIRVTVCAEFDGYCEAQYPAASIPTSDPLSTLTLYLGDRFRFDWLAAGTVYDCEKGALKTVTTGGPVRDDRDYCEAVAKIAKEWYDTTRATLSIGLATLDNITDFTVGDLITSYGADEAEQDINATVSQITLHLETGTGEVSCGFEELDFEGLV